MNSQPGDIIGTQPQKLFCPFCGASLAEQKNTNFCETCNRSINQPNPAQQDPTQMMNGVAQNAQARTSIVAPMVQ